jgi:hypothetical protein
MDYGSALVLGLHAIREQQKEEYGLRMQECAIWEYEPSPLWLGLKRLGSRILSGRRTAWAPSAGSRPAAPGEC